MSCVYFECVYLISKSCHIGQKKGEEMWKGVGGGLAVKNKYINDTYLDIIQKI